MRIFSDKILILLETAHRVAHSVSVFTLDKRLGRIVLKVFLAGFIAIIHRTDDV